MNLNPLIKKLLAVVEPEGSVVTMTLDLSKSGILSPATRRFLKREVEGNLLSHARPGVDQEFLRKLSRRIMTLAEKGVRPETDGLFLVAGRTVWEAVELRVPLQNYLYVGRTPYLAPLLEAIVRSPRAILVHVDPREARIEELHLGELRALQTIEGEEPRQGKAPARSTGYAARGNSARDRFQRKLGEHVHALLREAADWVAHSHGLVPAGVIYLIGQKEHFKAFKAALPPDLQKVAAYGGAWPKAERGIPTAILRDLAKRAEAMTQEESLLFQREKGRGLRAALGPRDTWEHLAQGTLGRVYLDASDPVPGVGCDSCRAVFAGLKQRCPFCEGDVAPTSVTQEVVRRAILHPPMALTFVPPGSEWLRDLDGMAGLLTPKAARRVPVTAGSG